ncbi:MAG: hydrolase [Parachlamydiales bacterium]|nr:hydrolase [Parachlamydiales bacterium]
MAFFINSSQSSGERGTAGSERSGSNDESIAEGAMDEEEDRSGKAAAGRTPDEFMKEAILMNSIHKRSQANVCVYLILRRKDQILFSLRQNTGYCDGYYGLVAGHVDVGESAAQAMIREANEEAGMDLTIDQLKPVHIMHRVSNRVNVDIFYECDAYQGHIANQEPDKCGALTFFPLSALPPNCIDYVLQAIHAAHRGCFFSEVGWS